jgi:hypothetical protein
MHTVKTSSHSVWGFLLHTSLEVKGWLEIGCVVSFGGFDAFLRFVIGGAGNEFESTLLTLIITPLKIIT